MKFIIIALGSPGDVNPLLGIGAALKTRGHEVLALTSENFKNTFEGKGIRYYQIASQEEYDFYIKNFNVEDTSKSFPDILDYMIVKPMKQVLDIVSKEYEKGKTVIMAFPFLGSARIVQEKLGVPLATIFLAPSSFRSCVNPPRFGAKELPRWTPKFVVKSIYAKIDKFMDMMVLDKINSFRKEIGLGPIKKVFQWTNSPDMILGLFPEWFAEPQKDWPSPHALTTFPLFDEASDSNLGPEVEDFLKAGSPPIVFMPGSFYNRKGKEFFVAALEACNRLGERAIFISKYPDLVPENLPQTVKHFSYVEFSILLKHSRALVHHGGIGTTSQALQAGIPHVVIAWWANDQYDNASRLKKIQVGEEILPGEVSAQSLYDKLHYVLNSKEVQQNCTLYAKKLKEVDPVAETCAVLENLVSIRK